MRAVERSEPQTQGSSTVHLATAARLCNGTKVPRIEGVSPAVAVVQFLVIMCQKPVHAIYVKGCILDAKGTVNPSQVSKPAGSSFLVLGRECAQIYKFTYQQVPLMTARAIVRTGPATEFVARIRDGQHDRFKQPYSKRHALVASTPSSPASGFVKKEKP